MQLEEEKMNEDLQGVLTTTTDGIHRGNITETVDNADLPFLSVGHLYQQSITAVGSACLSGQPAQWLSSPLPVPHALRLPSLCQRDRECVFWGVKEEGREGGREGEREIEHYAHTVQSGFHQERCVSVCVYAHACMCACVRASIPVSDCLRQG